MCDQQFTDALKKHPCPECGHVGLLGMQQMHIVATFNGKEVRAEGEGVICGACDEKFMSDALTESVANQVNRIAHGEHGKYIEVDRESGTITTHALN